MANGVSHEGTVSKSSTSGPLNKVASFRWSCFSARLMSDGRDDLAANFDLSDGHQLVLRCLLPAASGALSLARAVYARF